MSKKLIITIILILFIPIIVLAIRFFLSGPEDSWVCVNNNWTKHGKPNAPMPATGCGDRKLIGGDKDAGGCLIGAGYQYCPSTKKCQRMWEEYCEEFKDVFRGNENPGAISNFQECVAAGNPIMKSNPSQCEADGKIFIEELENTNEPEYVQKDNSDMIVLESPKPESEVTSPLLITGKARGNWFFEASFPVTLTNWDGLIIAEGIATAQGDWMTEDFVPFEAKLEFIADTTVSNRGSLILRKDNPSGLPENDDYLEITVFFKK